MRTGGRAQAVGAWLAALLCAAPLFAQPQPKTPPPPPKAEPAAVDEKTEAARRHFQNGVKLFQDGHFEGALAEFQASYALKAGASTLKNIALSQKALRRYSQAAETLRTALSKHGSEISEDDRRTMQQAIDELAQLVGSVVLRVTPATARVTVNGSAVEPAQRAAGISLNVGEHTVVAEAPGYAKVTRTVAVAGGQKNIPIDIQLQATAGFVTVNTQHPDDAIAIDGVAKAFQKWTGPLPAGRHYVQVYRKGFRAFDQKLWIDVGRSVQIDAPSLEPLPADEVPDPQTGQPKSRQLRGWYGLVALSFLGMRDAPDGLDVDESSVSGGSFGVRAGYRLWTPIAVEMLLEGSRHEVKDACDANADDPNQNGCQLTRKFTLDAVRLGPNLRIMSGGETVRFTSTLGAGAVRHVLTVERPDADELAALPAGKADDRAPDGTAKGWDPYFLLEVGAQFNWGHVLLEANVTSFIDGASNAKDGDYDPFEETGGLIMVGLGLRGGWSEWTPRDAK